MEFDLTGSGRASKAILFLDFQSRNVKNEACNFDLYSIPSIGGSIDKADGISTAFGKVKDNWFDQNISADINADVTDAWNNAIDSGRNYLAFRLAMDSEESYTSKIGRCSAYFADTGAGGTDPYIFYSTSSGSPIPDNNAPIISGYTPLTNPTINEGQQQPFSITKSDPEGDSLSVEWIVNGISVATNVDSYIFNSDFSSAGDYNVTVIVSDAEFSVSKVWTLTVQDVPIACSNNSECDDSNPSTIDACINPGTPSSYCETSTVTMAL